MPVEIRELIIRTQVGSPENEGQESTTSQDDNKPEPSLSGEELIRYLNDLLKRQKER